MNTTLICHSDGASRRNPGPAGAGVVVLGPDGRERRAISVFLGETTNNVAEYRALIEALAAATEVCGEDGVDPAGISVVIKTDSQLAARQIAGEYRTKNAGLIRLLGAFRKAAQAFRRVEVVCVPRGQNSDADRLANEAIDKALGKSPKRTATGAKPAARADQVPGAARSRYERVRASCGGVGVGALGRDGRGGACLVGVPVLLAEKVRAGRLEVCDSCGRLLVRSFEEERQ